MHFAGLPGHRVTLRAPNGIRTRAAALKGRCPRPLDDGGSTDLAALPVAPAVGDRPSIGDERQCRQSGYPMQVIPPDRAAASMIISGKRLEPAHWGKPEALSSDSY
jgi:hypothetical protein